MIPQKKKNQKEQVDNEFTMDEIDLYGLETALGLMFGQDAEDGQQFLNALDPEFYQKASEVWEKLTGMRKDKK